MTNPLSQKGGCACVWQRKTPNKSFLPSNRSHSLSLSLSPSFCLTLAFVVFCFQHRPENKVFLFVTMFDVCVFLSPTTLIQIVYFDFVPSTINWYNFFVCFNVFFPFFLRILRPLICVAIAYGLNRSIYSHIHAFTCSQYHRFGYCSHVFDLYPCLYAMHVVLFFFSPLSLLATLVV